MRHGRQTVDIRNMWFLDSERTNGIGINLFMIGFHKKYFVTIVQKTYKQVYN